MLFSCQIRVFPSDKPAHWDFVSLYNPQKYFKGLEGAIAGDESDFPKTKTKGNTSD